MFALVLFGLKRFHREVSIVNPEGHLACPLMRLVHWWMLAILFSCANWKSQVDLSFWESFAWRSDVIEVQLSQQLSAQFLAVSLIPKR